MAWCWTGNMPLSDDPMQAQFYANNVMYTMICNNYVCLQMFYMAVSKKAKSVTALVVSMFIFEKWNKMTD